MKRGRFVTVRSGFTLIEAMIASVILVLALSSVLAVASSSFRYVSDMRRWARSSQVLQQKMEDVRLINQWSTLWALNNTTFIDTNVPGTTFLGSISINSYNSPYPTSFVAQVSVTVTWTNTLKHVMTNELSTIVCQNGLNKYIF